MGSEILMEEIILEGKIKCKIYSGGKISKELPVFYNPAMKINRDITIEILRTEKKNNLQVADILAASGIRSIRLLKELPAKKIKNILVNDCSDAAIELIKQNIMLNNLKFYTVTSKRFSKNNKVILSHNDANKALLDGKGFDYIDIDPFGSPNPFLDSAIRRIARHGILAVTATDTSALAGTFENACKRKYWAKPLRNELMHEIGLRILIRKIQLIASQYEKAVIPMLSYSTQHYMRVFLRCEKGKEKADEILKQHKYILYCNNCMKIEASHYNKSECCNKQMLYAGPCWIGEINKQEVVRTIVKNIEKNKIYNKEVELHKLMQIMADESSVAAMGFYDIHTIVKKNNLKKIPKFENIINACKQQGFNASRTHFNEYAIKTTAPSNLMLDIIKKNYSPKLFSERK